MDKQNVRECPQIVLLFEVLEQNGLHKEKSEVQSLAEYIGAMESKLSQMMEELQGMRGEIKQIHDKSLGATCIRLLDSVEERLLQSKRIITTFKDNFILAADHAVKDFQEKGRAALHHG